MKPIILTAFLGAASALLFPASAQSPDVTSGTLPNGLTYHIRRNTLPEGRADFYLSRDFGSLVEKEDERGLAHFLEHMCFNGTEHFPGNSLIEWLASLGVKFGADLNAYTSMEETVYNISKVPVERESVLDSCLLVLRDWSCALTLADDDIDAERGVIKGEWRHRASAANRMLEKAAPRIYPDSPYGNRMPMGLMSVVENFPPQKLRDFYHRWHRTDNEAIIVVGDIDPAAVEKKIIATFSDIPLDKNAPAIPSFSLAPNEQPIMVVEADPEQSYAALTLYFKHSSPTPADYEERLRRAAIDNMLLDIITERIDDAELRPDACISKTGIGNMRFLLCSSTDALMLRTAVKAGREKEALATLLSEIERARKFGFSADEFSDAYEKYLENARVSRDKGARRSNTDLARELSRFYLKGEPLADPEEDYQTILRILPSIKAGDLRARLDDIVAAPSEGKAGAGHVAILYLPANRPETLTTEADLLEAYNSVDADALSPFEYQPAGGTLLAEEPAAGTITATADTKLDGVKLLTLSNGIKAYIHKSEASDGKILVRGIGTGGFSQSYAPELAPSMKLSEDAMAVAGAGEHSARDLRRILKGRDIKVSAEVKNTDEILEISTSAADVEDAFRLMWLKATAMRPDSAAFASRMSAKLTAMRGKQHSAIQIMGDSITGNVYDHHPLGGHAGVETILNADYDTILKVHADRFSDFSDFVFFISGDFDEAIIRNLLERYVASLPAAGRMEQPKDIGYHFAPGKTIHRFSAAMENPQAIVYQFRHHELPYTRRNMMLTNFTSQILKARLLADLRESRGWVYSIKGHSSLIAGMNGNDPARFMMPMYIKTDAGHADETAAVVYATIADMAKSVSEEEMNKVRENMLRDKADSRDDNGYWLSAMKIWDRYGLDYEDGYEEELRSLTPEELSRFVSDYVLDSEIVDLLMTPAE